MLEKAKRLALERVLCVNCLGRMFGGLLTGLDNKSRGIFLLGVLSMELLSRAVLGDKRAERELVKLAERYSDVEFLRRTVERRGYRPNPPENVCEICAGMSKGYKKVAELVIEKVREYEFESFLIGVRVPTKVEIKEDEVKTSYKLQFAESLREEMSREIGKEVMRGLKGKKFDPVNPDLTVIVDPLSGLVEMRGKDLVIEGRGSFPEGRIFSPLCDSCGGKGCPSCNYTGKKRERTFEFLVGSKLLELTGGRKWRFSIKREERDTFYFRFRISDPRRRRIPSKIDVNEKIKIFEMRVKDKT